MSAFDSKIFNAEVFGKYMDTVPRVKQNQLLKAGVLRTRNELKTLLTEQAGGNYITLPMKGRIGGSALNYDGATNITADKFSRFVATCEWQITNLKMFLLAPHAF